MNYTNRIREFLDGNLVGPNPALDILIWLNTSGYKKIRVSGPLPKNLSVKDPRSQCSLDKFLTRYVQYFFRDDISRAKIEQLYIKFSNQLQDQDAELFFDASVGKLELDYDMVEKYVGDRRFDNGTAIFQRPVPAEPEVAAPSEDKTEENKPDEKPGEKTTEGTEEPRKRRGGRRKKEETPQA